MKTLTISIVLAMAGTAYADQCQWVQPNIAAKAKKALANHPKVLQFCEPCGDKAPGVPETADRIELVTPDPGYREMSINGESVDLAYTYVRTAPHTYENLGMLVDCDMMKEGTATLYVEDATPNGVLITPAAPVPQQQPAPVQPPMVLTLPTAAPSPPPPPPPQIVVVETRPAFPWAMIALAGVTGFGATLFGVLTIAALRRQRRAMRPRASELRTDTADK